MVNSMNEKKIREFKKCIVEQMMEMYGINEFSARKAVRNSYLIKALKYDAETAMHNPIEYWCELIHDEEAEAPYEELKEM